MRRWSYVISILGVCVLGLAGCQKSSDVSIETAEEPVVEQPEQTEVKDVYIDQMVMENVELETETEVLKEAEPAVPAVPELLLAEASGVLVEQNESAVIDYSNTADGYLMVQYTADTANRLKVQVKGASTKYTYNLPVKEWTVFPLSDGNGEYQVTVFENVVDNKYATVLSSTFPVELTDEFAPFLRPNQYVDYAAAEDTVWKAAELTKGLTEPLDKVEVVYDYVVQNITYDEAKAVSVKSGYLPVLDEVLETGTGICFDYAALMTGMLRSQGVPCKLVVGYAGSVYHSWISVWTEESGWIDGVIFFDSRIWHRMDPTFASTGAQSADIMEFIGDGTNYTTKYLY